MALPTAWRVLRLILIAVIASAGVTASPAKDAAATSSDDALAQLASLTVKGRAPKTGYKRSQFGPAWSDDVSVPGGHDGCDTRFPGGS